MTVQSRYRNKRAPIASRCGCSERFSPAEALAQTGGQVGSAESKTDLGSLTTPAFGIPAPAETNSVLSAEKQTVSPSPVRRDVLFLEKLDGEVLPLRRTDVRDYQIDGEAVLFDPKTRKIVLLNHTALVVFRCCNGLTTIRQIADLLSKTYHVAFDNALVQVEQLMVLFADSRLVDLEGRA